MTEMAKNENSEQLVELILEEDGELYYLHVSPVDSSRAARDMGFATELLNQHKAAIDYQAINAIAADLEFVKKLLQEKTTNEIPAASGSQSSTQSKLQIGQKRSSTVVQLTDKIGNEDEKARKTKNGEEFCFWTESQTKLLLSLYKEYQSKLDEGSMRHKVFWTLVVEGLKQKGYAFTTVQCSTKMDTLKRAYKKVKDHNSQTGNDKKTCEHFEILDEMFSKKPWIKPLSQAGSNLPMDDFDENEKEKSKSRRTNSVNQEKSEFMRQTLENQRLRAEATAEYRKHKLEILKDLSSKFNC